MSAPSGCAVRPTPARVKEALFSILGERIAAARVLDLFAGSGAVGFEALSRGAAHVAFVEAHRPTAAAVAATARTLGVADRCTVIAAPAERAVARLDGRFDIVFADPPFAQGVPARLFAQLHERGIVDAASLLIYEHAAPEAVGAVPPFELVRSARYGSVALAFLRAAA